MCLFSIIVACYNEEKRIMKTLESVCRQTFEDYECLVIDGDSPDKTVAIVEEVMKGNTRIKIYSEPDQGIYNAMNKGIKRAKGRYIYFLNAGDSFYDSEVLNVVAKRVREQDADIVIGNINNIGRHETKVYRYSEDIDFKNRIRNGFGVCHQAVFASKMSLIKGFDEQYTIAADFNWLCESIMHNLTIVTVDKVIVNFDLYGVSRQAKYEYRRREECEKIRNSTLGTSDEYKLQQIVCYSLYKERRMYELMHDWLKLSQMGESLSKFFEEKKYRNIAIYGVHYIGQRLLDELKGTEIEVKYGIEKRLTNKKLSIRIVDLTEDFEVVDAIIVTPLMSFFEIKEELEKKLQCDVISIEDVIGYMYESVK